MQGCSLRPQATSAGEIPGNAEKWELSEDGLTYTFHLRPNLKWSDGSALNAHDFVYSWLRVITPETGSLYADQLLPYVVGAKEERIS